MMEDVESVVTTEAHYQFYVVVKFVACRTLRDPEIIVCRRQPSHPPPFGIGRCDRPYDRNYDSVFL